MTKTYATKAALITALEGAGLQSTSSGAYYVPGAYVCSHGEYDRPDYTPRHYKDGWALHASYYYYSGTFYARQDGRLDAEAMYYLLDA